MTSLPNDITIQLEKTEIIAIMEDSEIQVFFEAAQGPRGIPGLGANPADFGYEHVQVSALAIWEVNHNLGFKPNVQVTDSAGDSILPYNIVHDGVNRTYVHFGGLLSGNAYLS